MICESFLVRKCPSCQKFVGFGSFDISSRSCSQENGGAASRLQLHICRISQHSQRYLIQLDPEKYRKFSKLDCRKIIYFNFE